MVLGKTALLQMRTYTFAKMCVIMQKRELIAKESLHGLQELSSLILRKRLIGYVEMPWFCTCEIKNSITPKPWGSWPLKWNGHRQCPWKGIITLSKLQLRSRVSEIVDDYFVTWRRKIMKKRERCPDSQTTDVGSHLVRWIIAFLAKRRFQVKVGNS